MVNSTNNVTPLSTAAAKKQSASQDTGTDSGAFQALLAILLNQTVNFPGNDQSGLSGDSGQDSAMDMGNLNIQNILGQSGMLNSTGTDSFGAAIESMLGSPNGNGSLDIQGLLAGMMPSILDSVKNVGVPDEELQALLGKTSNAESSNTASLAANLTSGADVTEGSNIMALLDEIIPGSKAAESSNIGIIPDSIMKPVNQKDASKAAVNNSGAVKTENGTSPQVSTREALNQGALDPKTSDAQFKPKDTVLKNLPVQEITSAGEEQKTQPEPLNNAGKDVKVLSDSGINPTQKGEDKDKDYIIQRPDLLKIMRNEGITNTESSLSGNTSEKDGTEKNGSQVEHKEAGKDEAIKLQDLTAKIPDKPQDMVHGLTQNKEVQGNSIKQVSTGTEKLAGVNKDDILNQIYDKIKVTSGKDMSELRLNLKPEELGEVSIKLVMEKGIMTGRILVENSHVKDLIESNLSQVKDSLKAQNSNVSGFSVSVGLKQDGQQYNQNFSHNRWNQNKGAYSRGNFQEAAIESVPGVMNIGAVNILA